MVGGTVVSKAETETSEFIQNAFTAESSNGWTWKETNDQDNSLLCETKMEMWIRIRFAETQYNVGQAHFGIIMGCLRADFQLEDYCVDTLKILSLKILEILDATK